MALKTFEEARTAWHEADAADELKPEIELFFELSCASIFESSCKDQLALGQYL